MMVIDFLRINLEKLYLIIYSEPNIQDMFKENAGTEYDNSTCVLYDMFVNLFTKLCSLKNNIIDIMQTEPPDPGDDTNKNIDQTSPVTSNLPLSKTEKNGAVSTYDASLRTQYIPEKKKFHRNKRRI